MMNRAKKEQIERQIEEQQREIDTRPDTSLGVGTPSDWRIGVEQPVSGPQTSRPPVVFHLSSLP